ncbi:MAG: asparagine synthase (glutamine-hydrolyzing) [Phaeodactylibacter sp.]|nr:asparagine synthase (glutamine-hydrolyzing) [Phaeodactylibacter sp.]MCB9276620.1 asparagine synthase (glutamine-hydrolyzing) [Lewinellaceae bacterium]
MCGILGQACSQGAINLHTFEQMRDTLAHRGPDDAGLWCSEDKRIALGHRRLSFLDLSDAGHQPMANEDGAIWIVLNGEVYNYLELREMLVAQGHRFRSRSDTEVLIHGYEEWGLTGLLGRINGMYAFALWDGKKGELLLARDHFGIKPLYYGWVGGQFYFASELKAILKGLASRPALRLASVSDYLAYRYVPGPYTIWEGLYKLPAANYLRLSQREGFGAAQPACYWQLEPASHKTSPGEAAVRVGELLKNSVSEHLRSDVPVGHFLSGGYDSSALAVYSTALGQRPNAFSIGFEGWARSEHQYAETVANHLGIPLYTTIVGAEQLELMDTLAYHYDEPIADISIIPTYMVSQLARRHNKAVLSGEGADEIFGGYTWQREIAHFGRWRARAAQALQKLSGGPANYFVERYAEAMAMGRFRSDNLPSMLHPRMQAGIPAFSEWFYASHYRPGEWPLKAFQYLDVKAFMGELVLTKIDRASMAHGLEVRVPFLDRTLVEYLFQLHPSVYFRFGQTKSLLWENIRHSLPAAILNRPKQGFVGPDSYYMNLEWYREHLHNGYLIQDEVISREGLDSLFREKSHWRLWKLIVLEKWWNRWMR